MVSLIRFVGSVALSTLILGGCSYDFNENPIKSEPAAEEAENSSENTAVKIIPVGTVKPDLDYSSEQPDCTVAAQRITDNLQVGMTLADVERLVGMPRIKTPSTWSWTKGLSFGDRPMVKFERGSSQDDAQITSFSSSVGGC